MAKVTSKLQVTVPKALADRFGITPGDEIDWEPAGDAIRVVPSARRARRDARTRVRTFDQATQRLRQRQGAQAARPASDRGWTREELYDRGRAR
jgi:AbrB family looped-hinge helix DNA binding protein